MKLFAVLPPPLLSESSTVLNSMLLHLRLDCQPARCKLPPNFDHCETRIAVSLRDCTDNAASIDSNPSCSICDIPLHISYQQAGPLKEHFPT